MAVMSRISRVGLRQLLLVALLLVLGAGRILLALLTGVAFGPDQLPPSVAPPVTRRRFSDHVAVPSVPGPESVAPTG